MESDADNVANLADRDQYVPQVKICGLTRVEEALTCVEMGARAIGCVFYPKSPRHVQEEQARDIFAALPEPVSSVGVFVNEGFSEIMRRVEVCGLKVVQLHGQESPHLVDRLLQESLQVIKVLFANATPSLQMAESYSASAYLVECSGGRLPGGNALAWDWEKAVGLSQRLPLILAGGLNPDNVSQAIQAACPDAVDVSSGVEIEPGRKDSRKVKRLLDNVYQTRCVRRPRRIFQ